MYKREHNDMLKVIKKRTYSIEQVSIEFIEFDTFEKIIHNIIWTCKCRIGNKIIIIPILCNNICRGKLFRMVFCK